MTKKVLRICLTPVRNEEWIIRRFLECTSLWADHIILADQQSTDSTRKIAATFPKVILIDNPVTEMFNEHEMRHRLFDHARKIKGKKILFALDADEAFTGNAFTTSAWRNLSKLAPGTIIDFRWANLYPGAKKYWSPSHHLSKAFVDDGSPYQADKIHTNNIPTPPHARHHFISDFKILHYQYTDWQRMKSKQRWYQVWEWLNSPDKTAVQIYRQYHHMDVISKSEQGTVPKNWFEFYHQKNIDMTTINKTQYWWDSEVKRILKDHPSGYFSSLEIHNDFKPIFLYLRLTQRLHHTRIIRMVDKLISFLLPDPRKK